jgi:hypothetical protein
VCVCVFNFIVAFVCVSHTHTSVSHGANISQSRFQRQFHAVTDETLFDIRHSPLDC